MAADDRSFHQDAAAPGPAASTRFAEGILGKYFVAPVLRQRPSLVLRMPGRPVRTDASATASAVQGSSDSVPPVVRAAGRPALRGAAVPRLLVQRKPLVEAGTRLAAQPQHAGASAVQAGEAAVAALGARGRQAPGRMATWPFTGTVDSTAATGREGLAAGAWVGGTASLRWVATRQLPAAKPQAPVGSSARVRPGVSGMALPLQVPMTAGAGRARHEPSLRRRDRLLVQADRPASQQPLAVPGRPAPGGGSTGPLSGAEPVRAAPLAGNRAWPGADRLVQRRARTPDAGHKPATGRMGRPAWVPLAAAAAIHRAAPIASPGMDGMPPVVPGGMAMAQVSGPSARGAAQRREARPLVFGPAASAAAPARTLALQLKTMPPVPGLDRGAGLRERIPVLPPGSTGRPVGTPLHAPALTPRVAMAGPAVPTAGAATRAIEPGPVAAAQAATAVPTIVAATLGAGASPPAASPSGGASAGGAAATAASMPIQALADRVFSLLERRLVVERERRGIRS
jgi:hypothetical protein